MERCFFSVNFIFLQKFNLFCNRPCEGANIYFLMNLLSFCGQLIFISFTVTVLNWFSSQSVMVTCCRLFTFPEFPSLFWKHYSLKNFLRYFLCDILVKWVVHMPENFFFFTFFIGFCQASSGIKPMLKVN